MSNIALSLGPLEGGCALGPVVFVHGSLSGRNIWVPYIDALAPTRTIAVDLLGYGSAPAWPADRPYSLRDASRPICDVVAAHGRTAVDIVAHSFGGAVALRFAMDHPERVRSLTLIEPSWFNVLVGQGPSAADALRLIQSIALSFGPSDLAQDTDFAMARFVDFWSGRRSWAGLNPQRQQALARQSDQVRRDFEAIFSETLPLHAFRKLSVPTTIVAGTESPAPAVLVSRLLARAMPVATLMTFPGANHLLPLTHSPELIRLLTVRLKAHGLVKLRAA